MRLKEDRDSWHSSAIIKRDFRHDKSQPDDDVKLHRKKDTHKWCKGRVGVYHDFELQIPRNDPSSIRGWRKVPICKKCGKQDYHGTVYFNKKTGKFQKEFNWFDES